MGIMLQGGVSIGMEMSIGSAETACWTGGTEVARAAEARSARAFIVARRHSALVRVLRVALILGAVGIVLILVALGLYRTFANALEKLSVGQISIDGTKITMDKPRLTGARPTGENYVINAAKAVQDILKPTLIDLSAIVGDIGAADHDTLHVLSTLGRYDSDKETLTLSGEVRVKNNRYTVELKSAVVEFRTSSYSTKDPVTVVIDGGSTITADSATVREQATEITFEGHVKTVIRPKDEDVGATAPIKGTQP